MTARQIQDSVNAMIAEGKTLCDVPWGETLTVVSASVRRDGVWIDFDDSTCSKIADKKGNTTPGYTIYVK